MAAANTFLRQMSDAERRQLETWLEDFETSWTEKTLVSCVERLPPTGHPLRLAALIEMVKIDLEKQYGLNRRPRVEGYLHAYPELGTADTVPPDLLQAEYEVRCQFGEPSSLNELLTRFPRQAEQLRGLVHQARERTVQVAAPAKNRETVSGQRSTRLQLLPESAPEELPEQFGRYLILRRLGGGAMGTVYLATDTQLQRQVALKVPRFIASDGPDVRERFRREAQTLAALSHPNLCPVYDVGEIDDTPYITMAYVEGATVAAVLARANQEGRMLEPGSCAALVVRVAKGMAAAHKEGVLHRDLKPANIMIKKQAGEEDDIVVMDFGLARKVKDPRLTQSGYLMGTPPYMPPEVIQGKSKDAGASGDIYTLGVILYELLTGRLPFDGPDVLSVAVKVVTEEVPLPRSIRPELDEQLVAICLKAMAKNPEERYVSMDAFAAALKGYLRRQPAQGIVGQFGGLTGTGRVMNLGRQKAEGSGSRGRPQRLLSAAAGAAALLLGIVIIINNRGGNNTLTVAGNTNANVTVAPGTNAQANAANTSAPNIGDAEVKTGQTGKTESSGPTPGGETTTRKRFKAGSRSPEIWP